MQHAWGDLYFHHLILTFSFSAALYLMQGELCILDQHQPEAWPPVLMGETLTSEQDLETELCGLIHPFTFGWSN